MKRIALFLATNIAVLLILSITLRLLGFSGYLDQQGVDLNIPAVLLFAALFGFGGSMFSLLISKWSAKQLTGMSIIETPNSSVEQWLVQTVQAQAKEAGIGVPEIGIYAADEINAFATGANRNNALVAVSSGLLEKMRRDEAEAVLGHEISHIANGDMVTLTLIQGVVNTFVIFLSRVIGFLVDRLIFRVERGHGPAFWITTIVTEILLGVLASMIVMWFSRWREFRADAGGAKLAGRQKMIAALQRLQSAHNGSQLPDQLTAFGVSGNIGGGIKQLFSSHPPLSGRIHALSEGV